MSNDDVISKARPEEVFHHYNQLSAIAPLVMSDPSTAQALLRRRIEGGKNAIDPYDIDLTLKLDKGFRDRYRSASPKDE